MATYRIRSADREYTATVIDRPGGSATVTVDDQSFEVESINTPEVALSEPGPVATAAPAAVALPATPAPAGSGVITAPIPGKILSLKVKLGDVVSANQVVLILEAMKMENNVHASTAGSVKELLVHEGSEVSTGQPMMVIE